MSATAQRLRVCSDTHCIINGLQSIAAWSRSLYYSPYPRPTTRPRRPTITPRNTRARSPGPPRRAQRVGSYLGGWLGNVTVALPNFNLRFEYFQHVLHDIFTLTTMMMISRIDDDDEQWR